MSTPLRAVMIGHIVQIIKPHRIQLKLFFGIRERVDNRRKVVRARRGGGQILLDQLFKLFREGLLLRGHGGDLPFLGLSAWKVFDRATALMRRAITPRWSGNLKQGH